MILPHYEAFGYSRKNMTGKTIFDFKKQKVKYRFLFYLIIKKAAAK